MFNEAPIRPDTAIIDAALKTIHTTRSQLGVGAPATGIEYRDAIRRLCEISNKMNHAFESAPWEGPAGQIFAADGKALTGSIFRASAHLSEVALIIKKQAASVVRVRGVLDGIIADLAEKKIASIVLVESGNLPESLTFQEIAASDAVSQCNAAIKKFSDTSTRRASEMTIFVRSLARMKGSVGS